MMMNGTKMAVVTLAFVMISISMTSAFNTTSNTTTISAPVLDPCPPCADEGLGDCRKSTGQCTSFFGSSATCPAGYNQCSEGWNPPADAHSKTVTMAYGVYYMGVYEPFWVTVGAAATCTQTHLSSSLDFCPSILTAFNIGCLDVQVQVLPCGSARRLRMGANAPAAANNRRALVTDNSTATTITSDIEIRVSAGTAASLANDESYALLVRRGDSTLAHECDTTTYNEVAQTVEGEGCPIGSDYTYFVAVAKQDTMTSILSGALGMPSASSTPVPSPSASSEPTPAPSSSPLPSTVSTAADNADSSTDSSSPNYVLIGACGGAGVLAVVAGVVVVRSKSRKNAARKSNAAKSSTDHKRGRSNVIMPVPKPAGPVIPDRAALPATHQHPPHNKSQTVSQPWDAASGSFGSSADAVFAKMVAEVEDGAHDIRGPNPV